MWTIGSDVGTSAQPGWLRPQVEEHGLRQYIDVIQQRWWILVAAIVLTVGTAGLYLIAADKVYTGEADLLISPVPSEDTLLVSLGLTRQSGEPTREVETAARLAGSREVAALAQDSLGLDRSPESLLRDISIEPVAQSNLVSIEAEAPTPEDAADLANAYAEAVIETRDKALFERIDEVLPELTDDSEVPAVGTGEDRETEIARLEFLRAAGDPTIQIETPASPPTAPTSPRPALTLGAALFVGLVLGIGGAFGMQALDPRLRREEQLRSRYNLPLLARIPRDRSTSQAGALVPGSISPPTAEAYRTLRANLAGATKLREASRRALLPEPQSTASAEPQPAPHVEIPGELREGGQLILVTGSAPREGKTTTALNLATSFALTGSRVILIDADLRRPAIGAAIEQATSAGVVSTLVGNTALEEALVTTEEYGPNLRFLLAESRGPAMSELFSLRAAERLVEESRRLADYVIFDSPPLTAVIDAMPVARQVDDVLIVSRIGVTRLDRLHELAELLAANGIDPVGFALVGTAPTRSSYYYERPTRRLTNAPAGVLGDQEPRGEPARRRSRLPRAASN